MKAPFWTRDLVAGLCPCGSGNRAKACCSDGKRHWYKPPCVVLPPAGTGYGHPRCYFRERLACDKVLSHEHVISHAVLKILAGGKVRISGASWQAPGTEQVIPAKTLSAKILCVAHNKMLSPLDESASIFVKALLRLDGQLQGAAKSQRFHIVSGFDIERWFLKVYCGALAAGIARDGNRKRIMEPVPALLLGLLCGDTAWPKGWGLHAHASAGDTFQVTKNMGLMIIADADTRASAGIYMDLVGFRFFLSLTGKLAGSPERANFFYHVEAINAGKSGKNGVVAMTWNDVRVRTP